MQEDLLHAWQENGGTSEPNGTTFVHKTPGKRKGIEATGGIHFKRLQVAALGGSGVRPSADFTKGDDNNAAIAELLAPGERVIQKHHRDVQKAYRTQKAAAITSLNIRYLRGEIKTLEQQLRRIPIPAAASTANDVWNTAVQHFCLIRHGLHLTNDQLAFVRETIAPDVVYNTEYGLEAIVRNWCFVQWFSDVEVELDKLNKSARMSMLATTRTSVTITQQTLTKVFPHLFSPKTRDANPDLANSLLGQRIVMRGATCFEWDRANERVTSVVAQSDMLTPMLRLLGSLEDVSRVFDKALISSGNM